KEYSTPVVKKSLDPVWNTYFDFELNGVDTSKDIKIVVWDKDITRDDFLGMVTFDFGSIFKGNNGVGLGGVPRHYFDPDNKAYWRTLEKRKAHENVSGKILVKFGIIDEADRDAE
ncbi:C2 domain-containing protein, partial [Phycomyces nitens]